MTATSSKHFRDPEVIKRIPKNIRDKIDAVVAERVRRDLSTHFGNSDEFLSPLTLSEQTTNKRHRRDGTFINYFTL